MPISSKLTRRVDIKLQKPSPFSVKQSRTWWVPYLDNWLRRLPKAHFSGLIDCIEYANHNLEEKVNI